MPPATVATLPNPSLYACWSCIAKGVCACCVPFASALQSPLSHIVCTIRVHCHEKEVDVVLIRKFSSALLPVQAPWGRPSSTQQLL